MATLVATCAGTARSQPNPDSTAGTQFFDESVSEILTKRCIRCHNPSKTSGGLDLTSNAGLTAGGNSGLVVNRKAPEQSVLIKLVEHREKPRMPLDQPKLPDSDIQNLKKWIFYGSPYSRNLSAPTAAKEPVKVDRSFWSFRRLSPVKTPQAGESWAANPIDAFIAEQWKRAGLRPPATASNPELLRRLSLDVLGVPPSTEAISDFLNNTSPLAWEQLVDKALGTPGYGERWGRHWLDVVRYAESYGFEHDLDNANAYHFRDFVIHACNADQPFDQFIRWQLAGDELAQDNHLARLATGFLAAGPRNADIAQVRVEQERYDELDDIARTIGSGFLGLTIGCARCHDHKFDPLSQREYYEFIKVFDKSIRGELDVTPIHENQGKTVKALVAGEGIEPLARIYNPGPAFYEDTWFLNRGDVNLKEFTVSPGVIGVITSEDHLEFDQWTHTNGAESHGSRSSLAKWISDTDNGAGPLLARVIANRVWQFHFGRGIVTTPNDFGARGARRSHPDLLEWLAGELVKHDWSIKHLHRLILTSRTYTQASLSAPPTDSQVELFHGFPVRRLDADAIHDSLLSVTGQLSEELYGPSVVSMTSNRKAIYYRIKRSQLHPFLRLFDCPDTLQSSGKRPTSTVPSQALALLNSHAVGQIMADFATESLQTNNNDVSKVILQTFEQFLSRKPSQAELVTAKDFVRRQLNRYNHKPSQRLEVSLVTKGITFKLQATEQDTITSTQTDTVQAWSGSRSLPAFTPLDPSKPPRYRDGTDAAIQFGPNSTPLVFPNRNFSKIGTGDFTFTVRFRVPIDGGDDNQLLGTDSFNGQAEYSGFYLQQIGTMLRFTTRNTSMDGPQGYLDVTDRFEKGRWFVVTGKRSKNILSLTIDTDFPNTASRAEANPINIDNDVPFKIGDIDQDPSGRLNGDISHLLFYHRGLTDEEIKQNHDALRASPTHTLIRTPLEMAVADFCQTLACLNEFIYLR